MSIDFEELKNVFSEDNVDSREFRAKLAVSVYESQDIYAERFPYTIAKTLTGDRYVWNEEFIDKLLYSWSTDDLSNMSPTEYAIVLGFIDYQDRSTTVPSNIQIENGATGCTNPDENGISYVVYGDVISTDICLEAPNDVPRVSIYESLDNVMISILNCVDWQNQEIITGDIVYVSQCEI